MRMGPRGVRLLAVAALVPALAVTAACSSSSAKNERTPSASSAAHKGAALAARMEKGLSALTSAHLAVDLGGLGGKSTEDVAFTDGRVSASDARLNRAGKSVEVISVGGRSYAELPPAQNTTGKPWVLVSADSSNTFAKALAGTMSITNAAASLSTVTGFVAAAKSVQDKGTERLNGSPSTHYALVVDPAAAGAAAGGELKQMLALLGNSDLPVELWVDEQNRPVKFSMRVPLGKQQVSISVVISKFNAPLHITAPPAGQVSTG